jgi:hypothetical protein
MNQITGVCLSTCPKKSLTAVLLNNEHKLTSLPVTYSSSLKEFYENLQIVLKKIIFNKHKWNVCYDLQVCGILLGQQIGYIKFLCFLCDWDSSAREKYWTVSYTLP